jgi:hypothetical protein
VKGLAAVRRLSVFAPLFVLVATTLSVTAGEISDSLRCKFGVGTQMVIDSDGQYDPTADSGDVENREYIFYGISDNNVIGSYRNLNRGWEGKVHVLRDGYKVNLIEQADASDNNFVVTVFGIGEVGDSYPAILSQHSYVPGILELSPVQLIGTCN